MRLPWVITPSRKSEDGIRDGAAIKVNTDVVTLAVTVTDSNDSLVTGLDSHHFEVFEDKVKQKIEYFNDEDAPISAGIIFDLSGSMWTKIDQAREALKALVETSHDDDDFFLIGFNHRPELLAEFSRGEDLLSELNLVYPSGRTAVYDAAYLGIEKVKQGRHRRKAIILISDGQDNSSRYKYRELQKLVKEANVQIYCIGIVEIREEGLELHGRTILADLSSLTGGKAFFPNSDAELEDAAIQIALELRHQYSIGYIPNNDQRKGEWRKIAIRINSTHKRTKLYVRTKEGYYASPR